MWGGRVNWATGAKEAPHSFEGEKKGENAESPFRDAEAAGNQHRHQSLSFRRLQTGEAGSRDPGGFLRSLQGVGVVLHSCLRRTSTWSLLVVLKRNGRSDLHGPERRGSLQVSIRSPPCFSAR